MLETSIPDVARMVHHCCDLLGEKLERTCKLSGLVVGCGNGNEVVYMRRTFNYEHLVGVDVENIFSAEARAEQCVTPGDALCLPFAAEAFDFAADLWAIWDRLTPAPGKKLPGT